ncbi:MAG: thioredoxin [Acidaminococcus sp.]|nr:thioredoxin [Acidaminococcus sp.]MDY4560055.1 thioredoxin [Eubacteriales bacterium]MDY5345106.1 thioredoxin [Eubacteriales bacterium]
MSLEITSSNFEETIKGSDVVLVDFWATWCGPCKMIAPIIDEIANEFQGKAVVGKVNVDENATLAEQFGIMSIPTMIIFKNGEIAEKMVGPRTKAQIEAALTKQM